MNASVQSESKPERVTASPTLNLISRPWLFENTPHAHYLTVVCISRKCRLCRIGWFSEIFAIALKEVAFNART